MKTNGGLGRYLVWSTMGCVLVGAGFVIGWKQSRQFMVPVSAEVQRSYLREKGDAPDAVRAEVLQTLQEFQEGYRRRDAKQIDAFMEKLFARDEDVRVVGTDAGEWRTGYEAIAEFIRSDWLEWGDVHLAVEEAVASASGDAAWVATTGRVVFKDRTRAMRFTAVLTRREGRWMFRQVQFQWDERPMVLREWLKRGT